MDFSRYPDEAHQIDWLTCYLRARHEREPTRAEVEKLLPQVHIFAAVSAWPLKSMSNVCADLALLLVELGARTGCELDH